MEVILHIGMGKTGTSSIQAALRHNRAMLQQDGLTYLGMWFNIIDAAFSGLDGQNAFFKASPEEMRDYAKVFVGAINRQSKESGSTKFLISNEGIFGQVHQIKPFIQELRRHVNVKLIVYMRDPWEWLPSAYNQWSIFHKNYDGPLRSYSEMGRTLIGVYRGFQAWHSSFSDILTIRPYTKTMNAVEDFSSILALHMEIPEKRVLERVEISEGVLRAIYNNRVHGNALPNAFNDALKGVDFYNSLSLEKLLRESFSYDETSSIIEENSLLFESIKEKFGIDFAREDYTPPAPPDSASIRERLFEHVLQIVMQQADRITELERVVARLQNEQVKQ